MINITINGTPYPVPSSAADTNWAAPQVAFEQALAAAVTTNSTNISENTSAIAALQGGTGPLTWSSAGLTYQTGWSGTLQYAKDAAGRVWWRGTASYSGGNPTIVAVFLALPAGSLPPVDAYFLCAAQSSATLVRVEIASTGFVGCLNGPNNPTIDFGQVFYDTHAF